MHPILRVPLFMLMVEPQVIELHLKVTMTTAFPFMSGLMDGLKTIVIVLEELHLVTVPQQSTRGVPNGSM